LLDLPYGVFLLVALLVIGGLAIFLPWTAIERIFGYGGCAMVIFAIAVLSHGADWSAIGHGFIPSWNWSPLYLYFVVGIVAAILMPYEIYFYSSGGIEEGWTVKDLSINRANSIIGFAFGGLLVVALIVVSAEVFAPRGISPDSIGTVASAPQTQIGIAGLLIGLIGMLFTVGGAAIETAFSGAYNIAQSHNWRWGKKDSIRTAPKWYVSAIVLFVLGFMIISTGIDPVQLTEYSVVFSVLVLPLTYFPLLRACHDRNMIKDHASGIFGRTLAWIYFVIICLLAVSGIPLLIITNAGQS